MTLAEKTWGAGLVLFGGMTTDNFHGPNPQSGNQSDNILAYADAYVNNVVPEPSTYLLLASGLMAVGFAARRRRSSTSV